MQGFQMPCHECTVILIGVGCLRLCWFAPTPLLERGHRLQYWGVMSGHPYACAIVILSRIHIHIVSAPRTLLGHHFFCSWGQALYGIWKLCCLSRQFCWVHYRLFLESWMLGSGVVAGDRHYWRYIRQVVRLSCFGVWYGRQGQL